MAYETEIIPTEDIIIRNCPFCGNYPKITKDVRYPRNTEESVLYFANKWNLPPEEVPKKVIAYEVSCSNNDCIIHHNTSKFFLSMEEAIEKWNKRIDYISALAFIKTMSCSTNIRIDFYKDSIKIDEYKGDVISILGSEIADRIKTKIVGSTETFIEDEKIWILINVYDIN